MIKLYSYYAIIHIILYDYLFFGINYQISWQITKRSKKFETYRIVNVNVRAKVGKI